MNVENRKKLLLIDDHVMVRRGLSEFLGAKPDLIVAAEASSREEAISIVKSDIEIDVVLLDLTLKHVVELGLIRRIHVIRPETPILIVSMHDEKLYAGRAMEYGASGYVMKQEPGDVLVEGIRAVVRGEIFLSENAQLAIDGAKFSEEGQKLTPMEEEILQMIAEGKSSVQIAEEKCRSIKTIETHRSNIRIKLGLKDGADLIRYAAVKFNLGTIS